MYADSARQATPLSPHTICWRGSMNGSMSSHDEVLLIWGVPLCDAHLEILRPDWRVVPAARKNKEKNLRNAWGLSDSYNLVITYTTSLADSGGRGWEVAMSRLDRKRVGRHLPILQ